MDNVLPQILKFLSLVSQNPGGPMDVGGNEAPIKFRALDLLGASPYGQTNAVNYSRFSIPGATGGLGINQTPKGMPGMQAFVGGGNPSNYRGPRMLPFKPPPQSPANPLKPDMAAIIAGLGHEKLL